MKQESNIPLVKYTRPCSRDFEPYLTQWIFHENDHKELYIQASTDSDKPRWERAGNLLESALLQLIKE
jgi:hypothetical protein